MKKSVLKQLLPLIILTLIVAVATLLLAKPVINLVRDVSSFKAWIYSFGRVGIIMFTAIQILQVIVFVIPAEVIQIAGGYLYGALWGSVLSIVGITFGSFISFGLSRLLGRKSIENLLSYHKVGELEKFLNQPKGEIMLFVIFLIPGMPKDVLAYVAGLTPMKFWRFAMITLIARSPSIFVSAYWGANIASRNYVAIIAIAVAVALILLAVALRGKNIL